MSISHEIKKRDMKKTSMIIVVLFLSLILGMSGCKSKSGSWSKEEKDKWTASCMKFMQDRNVDQKDAAGFCDCMLKKTSEKYTPEEAVKITPAEEQQLWKECNYSW
jgi:hypothetical protein